MTFLPASTNASPATPGNIEPEPFYRRYLVQIVALFTGMAFLVAPWSFERKARAAMHGLCAQTPGHTFFLDGRALPFDGRMTGIYAGLLSTVVIMVLTGRHHAAGLPSLGAGIILMLFVGMMAFDGFNSLLTDLEKRHFWDPSNEYRFLTGWMAGVAIGIVLTMLVGMTIWQQPRTRDRVVSHWWVPVLLLLPLVPVRLLIGTGSPIVYYPLSFLLMAGALIAFTLLALVTLLMVRNRENQFERFSQLQGMTVLSMLIAIVIISAIGGGRFWLESVIGIPAAI